MHGCDCLGRVLSCKQHCENSRPVRRVVFILKANGSHWMLFEINVKLQKGLKNVMLKYDNVN